MAPKICAVVSLLMFVAAAWIGFVDRHDKNRWENKLKGRLNVIFIALGCNWAVDNPYILTRIGLIVGFGLGMASIILV